MARLGGRTTTTAIAASDTQLANVGSATITLAALIIDRSSSTAMIIDDIRGGQRDAVLDLQKFPKKRTILMAQYLFNDRYQELHAYVPMDQVVLLDDTNCRASGSTMLDKTLLDVIVDTEKLAAKWRSSGFTVNVVYGIFTDADGDNESASHGVHPRDVKKFVEAALTTESAKFFYLGMGGLSEVEHIKFAGLRGIPANSVKAIDPGTPADEVGRFVRHHFNLFSQSVKAVSQTVTGATIDPAVDAIWSN